MIFLTSNIHGVSKISISSAEQLSENSPTTLVRNIIITADDGKTYAITLFSNKDELIPLEVS